MAATASDLPRTWMTPTFSRWFGIGCLGLTLTLDAIFLALLPYGDHEDYSLAGVVVALPTFVLFSAVGALILSRQPGHAIGALFVLATLAMMATNTVTVYVEATELDLPGRALLAALSDPLWQLGAVSLGIYLPLLFPTGTYLSQRWRWAGRVAGVCLVLIFVTWAFRPAPLSIRKATRTPSAFRGLVRSWRS